MELYSILKERVEDHETRIRSLEKWVAWVGGAMFVIQAVGGIVIKNVQKTRKPSVTIQMKMLETAK